MSGGAGDSGAERRPLATRERAASKRVASIIVCAGISPNAISILSVVFALVAAAALVATASSDGLIERACWIAAAAFIQLRLLANMFDGMVAIERGIASPIGELFNEIPDRISDPVILVAAGFAAGGDPWIGGLAAISALFVAYVRAVGAASGAGQIFAGPMAKPQRMFLVTLVCLYAGCTPIAWQPVDDAGRGVMAVMLGVIVIGCVVTSWRRVHRVAIALGSAS